MRFPIGRHPFWGFFSPYRTVERIEHPTQIPHGPLPQRGAALLWNLAAGNDDSIRKAVQSRPPALALILVLPPTLKLDPPEELLTLMEHTRPHSVLPHMERVDPHELAAVLRRFPSDFAGEVTEFLQWRGIQVDLDTRRLMRRTFDLSVSIRTVSSLARSLYMSRRALGRRFLSRGLPVPSHWLHFGRVLRASIRLQVPSASLFSVACDLGYPDGFALSNQMNRLTGLRPSLMKSCFGWEWVVESWLHHEAVGGNLSPEVCRTLFPALGTEQADESDARGIQDRSTTMRVAEQKRRRKSGPGG
jgi:AraC-like DNA-binding protein